MVTHLITNQSVSCLSTAERTGSSVFKILWSYVEALCFIEIYIGGCIYLAHLYFRLVEYQIDQELFSHQRIERPTKEVETCSSLLVQKNMTILQPC